MKPETTPAPVRVQPKGIIFTAQQVRDALAGRKVQHRIPVKPQPHQSTDEGWPEGTWFLRSGRGKAWMNHTRTSVVNLKTGETTVTERVVPVAEWLASRCPFPVGSSCYVKETWTDRPMIGDTRIHYKADGIGTGTKLFVWRSPIHMPRTASRLTLEIVGVKVERVQDISEEDAKAEGIPTPDGDWNAIRSSEVLKRKYLPHVTGFRDLWDSIHGKGAWASNPFVWCLTFAALPARAGEGVPR